jgi:hypothetical protein
MYHLQQKRKKTTTGLGMTVIITLGAGQLIYDFIRNPVKFVRWAIDPRKSWY